MTTKKTTKKTVAPPWTPEPIEESPGWNPRRQCRNPNCQRTDKQKRGTYTYQKRLLASYTRDSAKKWVKIGYYCPHCQTFYALADKPALQATESRNYDYLDDDDKSST